MMRKTLSILTLSLLLVAGVACSGSQKTADTQPTADAEGPANEPPSDPEEAEPKMPDEGPALVEPGEEVAAESVEVDTSDIPEDAPVVSRKEIDTFMEHGPAFALTIISVEPVHGQQSFKGFQLVDVRRDARQFLMPQVRVGDVITHINGIRMKKPDDYLQAWRSLARVSAIRIDFLRKEEPQHAIWKVE